ncbi:MAG: NAD(P)/FAD-dependent oxidoreductase [Aquisalimonadaceae bacterium]
MSKGNREVPRVVVVGGGAGGLELATRLGRTLGKRNQARITLVDANLTHIWKPLLHEVAAGTLDSHEDALNYLAQASRHHFRYQYGCMSGLDRNAGQIILDPLRDEEGGELVASRRVDYDLLIIAVGSISNNFGTPGAAEHCTYLDTAAQAERFQQRLVRAFLRAQIQAGPLEPGQLSVAIVGGGATGVELAAELRSAARKAVSYGLDRINPETDLKLTVIEAADRLLPALSPKLSRKTHASLDKLGVRVLTGSPVIEVTEQGVRIEAGEMIPAELRVWAAGIKAPDWLKDLDGLESARSGQLVVDQQLRTTRDPAILAMGDCAFLVPDGAERPLPPRAQTASQQARYLSRAVPLLLAGQQSPPFVYRDYGSLISLSEEWAVGRLMGGLFGTLMIEGILARTAYAMLYRKHLAAVHGIMRTLQISALQWMGRRARPRLKLH